MTDVTTIIDFGSLDRDLAALDATRGKGHPQLVLFLDVFREATRGNLQEVRNGWAEEDAKTHSPTRKANNVAGWLVRPATLFSRA